MRLVVLESPFAGDIQTNVAYARACLRDSLMRDESPIASHLLYTQMGILSDDDPEERQKGIDAGLAWLKVADASVVYTDRGISKGMNFGIEAATKLQKPIEYRSLNAFDPELYLKTEPLEKVRKYERFLHALQMYAEVVMDGAKVKKLIDNACNWSYAHRRGNGEYSEEEQEAIIKKAFYKLTEV